MIIIKKIFNRLVAILPALIMQIGLWVICYNFFKSIFPLINAMLSVLAIIFVLFINYEKNEPSYKMIWLIVILAFPVFGAWMYLFFGNKRSVKPIDKRIEQGNKHIEYKLITNNKAIKKLKDEDNRLYQTISSMVNISKLPINYVEDATYFSIGEDMFKDMLIELEKAKKFVFIEYFILEEGLFLNSIIEILERKVKEGVDVRIIYDDLGSISTYSLKNMLELRSKGIKCTAFNPLIFIKSTLNNRDHRKMMIIDNKVVYSGGINIADEYINEKKRFGHWKDIGFKLTGEPVLNYTYMFVEFWNAYSSEKLDDKIFKHTKNKDIDENNGLVFSYYDSPSNKIELSNDLYVDLLYQAEDYVWFYSPYLIIGEILQDAIIRTAKRGVNIKIFVPGIPDKKMINRITKSYYLPLIDAGVEILEYTPGFLHAKACIVDDKICTIGTVNLDYRSLFLHFECNSLFYKSKIIVDVKEDFKKTAKKCKKISYKHIKNRFFKRLIDSILRIVAPLC